MKTKKKWTQAQDDADDRKHGVKEGSKRDLALDRSRGLMAKKKQKVQKQEIVTKKKAVRTSGKFGGKSNALGQGGRAAQLRAQGVPGGVIGNLARAAQAAPGQANYHKGKKSKSQSKREAYMKRVSPSKK